MLKLKSFFIAFFVTGTVLFGVEYTPNAIPYPSSFPLLERQGYSLVYDGRNKIPLWTQEHLTKDNVSGKMGPGHFRKDDDLYGLHQSLLSDYKDSGFDRGHMVPDADRDNTKEIRNETYLLSNVCPQVASFNRHIWADLEAYIRNLVTEHGYDSVDVITGPLFLPDPALEEDGKRYVKYQVIGDNDVAFPRTSLRSFMQIKAHSWRLGDISFPQQQITLRNLVTTKSLWKKLRRFQG